MKKFLSLLPVVLSSAVLTHTAMANMINDQMSVSTPDVIKTTHGDLNAYGRPLAHLKENLQQLDFKAVEQNANNGDDKAQFLMAKFYELGVHVTQNQAQAMSWYEKSAKLGNADAQNNLAVYYFENDNPKKGKELLDYATNQYHPVAMTNLGVYLFTSDDPKDKQKGMALLKSASATGYAPADYMLATAVYENTKPELALQYLQKSAEAGFAPAQWEMASRLQMGVLSPVSPEQRVQYAKKAVMWADRACANHHNLGCRFKDYYAWDSQKETLYQEYQDKCHQGDKSACQEATSLMQRKHAWESIP